MPRKKKPQTEDQKKQERQNMIKKAQEEAGITTESGEPLPKNVLDYVYIDPITPVPRVPLDDLERRVFGLDENNNKKWRKKRGKFNKTKLNFIEKNPQLAEIRLSHAKTYLCYDLPILEALLLAGISRKQYYKIRKDESVGQILERWCLAPVNTSRLNVNLAIRKGDAHLAFKFLTYRDKRFMNRYEEAEQYSSQLINLFLNVKQETKDLILTRYTSGETKPLPSLPISKDEKSAGGSNLPEDRGFLSQDS